MHHEFFQYYLTFKTFCVYRSLLSESNQQEDPHNYPDSQRFWINNCQTVRKTHLPGTLYQKLPSMVHQRFSGCLSSQAILMLLTSSFICTDKLIQRYMNHGAQQQGQQELKQVFEFCILLFSGLYAVWIKQLLHLISTYFVGGCYLSHFEIVIIQMGKSTMEGEAARQTEGWIERW